MQVEEHSAAARHEHDGVIYYFCSTHCGESFEESPQKYLTQIPLPGTLATS